MRLEEFDLDLPYVINEKKIKAIMKEKGYSEDKATKFDYEQNWKETRRKFRLETRCISAMVERIIESIETKECWKILIECVDSVKETKVLNFSGVYTVQVQLDYDDFFSGNNLHKKEKTLQLLLEGYNLIAKSKGWSLAAFRIAYEKIIQNEYKNEWFWKKPVKSPDKLYSAEVFMQHDVDFMNISIIIKDKNKNEIGRKTIISEKPDEFAYAKHLGALKWISAEEVALFNKNQDEKVSYIFNN